MSAITMPAGRPPLSRRDRAAVTAAGALRGGLLGALAAGAAWAAAFLVAGTVWLLLIVATLLVGAYVIWRGDVRPAVWGALAAAWAIVLLERWIVQEHGGLWVAAAAYAGVVIGARRAGISRWTLPLLAYPLLSVGIVIAAGEDLLEPWGSSWLWLAAVLGPVIGVRTVLGEAPDVAARRG
jgi:hypothetical protein